MRADQQASVDFIVTYGIIILGIIITVALFIGLYTHAQNVIPQSCSIYGTLGCSDVAYATNSVGATLVVLASSQVYGKVNISSFNAVVGGIASTNGYCTANMLTGGPTQITQGQTIYCIAKFPTQSTGPLPNQAYTGTFNISGNYCPSGTGKCPRGSTYNFRGSFKTYAVAAIAFTTSATTTIGSEQCGAGCQYHNTCDAGYQCLPTYNATCQLDQGYSCQSVSATTSTTIRGTTTSTPTTTSTTSTTGTAPSSLSTIATSSSTTSSSSSTSSTTTTDFTTSSTTVPSGPQCGGCTYGSCTVGTCEQVGTYNAICSPVYKNYTCVVGGSTSTTTATTSTSSSSSSSSSSVSSSTVTTSSSSSSTVTTTIPTTSTTLSTTTVATILTTSVSTSSLSTVSSSSVTSSVTTTIPTECTGSPTVQYYFDYGESCLNTDTPPAPAMWYENVGYCCDADPSTGCQLQGDPYWCASSARWGYVDSGENTSWGPSDMDWAGGGCSSSDMSCYGSDDWTYTWLTGPDQGYHPWLCQLDSSPNCPS